MLVEATFSPTFSAGESFHVIFITVGQRSELVEGHVNIGADTALDLHRFFWANKIRLTIERVTEINPIFSDMGEAFLVGGINYTTLALHRDDFAKARTEWHDLEATRIGEGRPMPIWPVG